LILIIEKGVIVFHQVASLIINNNDVEVCQKSCKLVHAFWRRRQSNVAVLVFWGHPMRLCRTS